MNLRHAPTRKKMIYALLALLAVALLVAVVFFNVRPESNPEPQAGRKIFAPAEGEIASQTKDSGPSPLAVTKAPAGQIPSSTTHLSKASLMTRLVKYVDWNGDQRQPGEPFVFGVAGDDAFAEELKKAVEGKKLKNRDTVVKLISTLEEVDGCQVLYLGEMGTVRQKSLLGQARRAGVLTFGESKDFASDGGAVTFYTDNGVVRMRVNEKNLNKGNLRLAPDAQGLF